MLKQSVRLVSLLSVFWLPFSYQQPLAPDVNVISNTSYNSVAKPTESSRTSVIQPTRLEINIEQRQVTIYQGTSKIKTYPIAVGRRGWETPTGNFQVAQMLRNPTWIHPFTEEKIAGEILKILWVATGLVFGQTVKIGLAFTALLILSQSAKPPLTVVFGCTTRILRSYSLRLGLEHL